MRLWQEQMLKSRQLVLAQQAKSAVQQANKAQRELYIGNLAAGQVTEGMLQQVFNSALIAAFPNAGMPGCEPVIKVRRLRLLGVEWCVHGWCGVVVAVVCQQLLTLSSC
jgi:hypothetical protein